MGRSPPHLHHLLEACDDLIDDCVERSGGNLARFDRVTALLSMQVEGDEYTDGIFVDQLGPVAAATGTAKQASKPPNISAM